MRHTMQYSVNGQTMDVGADENDQFMQAASERGYKPEAVHTYRINNETMQVPESQLNDFMAASKQRGYEPQRIQRLTMDDGTSVNMTEKDIEDFSYNAANGFRISRKDMERAGVPQMLVRSAADRAKFGTELAQMFHPEYFGNLAPQETPVVEANFGMRNDGKTYKGTGWLGVLKTADGGVATEYTSQSNAVTDRDGNRIDFPTLVPTLTEEEVGVMLNDIIPNKKPVPDSIMQKAVDHALEMQRRGRSVFANDGAAPKQNLGVWETLRQQKQQELGKEIGDAELTATLLPFIGTIMSAAERGKESNEQRLYFGNYRDSTEAGIIAHNAGIPWEVIKQINAKASAGQMPRRPFGGLDSDQYDMKVLGDEYRKLMNDALKERIIARQNAGEQLSQNELDWLQNAAVGAVGAGAAIAEMANPVVASATLGASAMNRAARMANGPLELDENGNVRREAVRDQYGNVVTREDGSVIEKRGTDGDTAMLKGFAGAALERVIWSGATAKAFKALPGGAKVADKIARGGFLKKNAGELAGMVAKTRLTELADDVAGLNVADYESGESFGDWLVKTANPVETVKTALELLPVHAAMKGFGKIKNYASKDAREHMANVKKAREDIDKAIGKGKSANLTDVEVLKLHELSTSDGLTQEKIDGFVSKVGKDADASAELFSAAADFAKQMRGNGFRMSDEASASLASDIVQQVGTERAKEVFDKAKKRFSYQMEVNDENGKFDINDPEHRYKAIEDAAREVFGEQGNDGARRISNADERTQAEVTAHNRHMRTPTRVGEKEIAEDQAARAMGKRIEQEGEAQRKAAEEKAQAEYDEKMAAYEEARAKREEEKKRFGRAKTELPEKPTPPELRVEKPKKPVIEVDLTEKPQNPAEVDTKTPKNAEKVPDGRGKMVEKPQSRQSDENGPTGVPQEKGTTSRPNAAKPVEGQNGASDAKVKGDKLGRTQSQIDEDNRIVADYDTIADAPNVINGDSIRKNMKGFKNDDTDTHHALTPRSTEIREKLFEKKLAERKGKGSGSPNEVLFTMGGGGSGKSTASKGLSDEVDFTYDSTGANLNDMRDKISRVIANGQKPKVLFVYCDPKTAWGRVASRTEKGGHAVSENDFAGVHAQAIRNFDALRNEFGDAIIPFVIDNRGEVGKTKFIKADEFSKLPRYTKKEILDVITGRGGKGSRGAGGAQEPSGKRGQVNQPSTVRVPDGKGRMVTKPAPVSKTESAAKPDWNGVYPSLPLRVS